MWDENGYILIHFFYNHNNFMQFENYAKEMNIKLDIIGKIMLSRYDYFDSDKNLNNYFQYLCPELFGIISDYALYKNLD